MSEKEMLTNYLSILKSDVEVYVHGTIESKNKDSKEHLKYGLDQTLLSVERTFNELEDRSWYNVENVNNKEISKVFKKINESF